MERGGYAGPLSVEIEFKGEPWPPITEVDDAMARSRDYLLLLGVSDTPGTTGASGSAR